MIGTVALAPAPGSQKVEKALRAIQKAERAKAAAVAAETSMTTTGVVTAVAVAAATTMTTTLVVTAVVAATVAVDYPPLMHGPQVRGQTLVCRFLPLCRSG